MADPEDLFGVDIKAVRDRLRLLKYFTDVQDIQGGAQAIGGYEPFVPPAAFVSIAAENYKPQKYAAGGFAQSCEAILSVLMCIPANRADSEKADEVEQARKVTAAQLLGWQPPGAISPLQAVRYQVRLIADGFIWPEWQFRTKFDISLMTLPPELADPPP